MALITKQQLIERTRISAQLSDRQVLPFIQDAEMYDLPTLLSGGLIADITPLNITAAAWVADTAYLTGTYSIQDAVYYKALQDTTGIMPGTDAAIWQADYKATLRYIHLPDFLIWSAYDRMLLEHGRNVTEAGLTVPADPENTYQSASDKSRGELMASAKNKANFHRGIINAFMSKNNLIQSNGCNPTSRRTSGRVSAV